MGRWKKRASDMVKAEEHENSTERAENPREELLAEGLDERRKKQKRYRLSGSKAVKAIVFVLLAIFCSAGIASGFLCGYMVDTGYYKYDLDELFRRELHLEVNETADKIKSFLEAKRSNSVLDLCQEQAIGMELVSTRWDGVEISHWKKWIGGYDRYIVIEKTSKIESDGTVYLENYKIKSNTDYTFRFYIDPLTSFQGVGKYVVYAYNARYILIGAIAGFAILLLICFIFILYSAGHRKGREEIVPGVLTRLPLDIVTLLFAGVEAGLYFGGMELSRYLRGYWFAAGIVTVGGAIGFVFLTIYFMDLSRRVKMGKFWRNSLIYMLFGILWKGICLGARGLAALFKMFPAVVKVIIVYLGICILEFVYMMVFVKSAIGITLWGIEKLLLLFLIVYITASYKKLFVASGELARGQENYRVDTSKMFSWFKEHGENLNSVGQGISRAVAEKMKSEHLKTELISNVSHDLKTPLTSIINYADLICEEASGEENEKIREYAEVQLRQSRRLKKLLEDLMEASKAATGNLEVNLMPCEVSVLLSQIVGEYQRKMEELELELIARQPEQPARIMADGRHLWRVFDNLMNNICKYAQEKSRVYLNVELKEGKVLIIFRNMSKYALDISGEELEERFVRGDKSRHMEGNGLGLSIAKSLMDLQNGKIEIITDGDLFKVILSFNAYEEQLPDTSAKPPKQEMQAGHEPEEGKMKLLSVRFGNNKRQKQ